MNFNNVRLPKVPGGGAAYTLLKVYAEGTHLIAPGFEWPIIYDVRARPHLVESLKGAVTYRL